MSKSLKIYIFLGVGLVLLFGLNLVYGAVKIPVWAVMQSITGGEVRDAWKFIVLDSRLPQAVTALCAGAALAVSGLLLQTLFRNPLADPSILGVSNGASLGVALIMLYLGGTVGSISGIGGYVSVVLAALMGSFAVLGIIIFFSKRVRNNVMLLIIGIMVGYLTSSAITFLNYYAAPDKVHQFLMWGMGDFSPVSKAKLPYFLGFALFGLVLAVGLIKPLNALLLGEQYAANLGLNIKRIRIVVLLATGLLAAVVTAFCGPISFIGLAVPHIARLLLGTSNHRVLLPITVLAGACVALVCNALTVLPGGIMMPLNAITPLVGAPVIIYVIMNRKNLQYFN